jgi:hypothetical protein
MRIARLLFVTTVAAAAIGCGEDDESSAREPNGGAPPVACTEIGCDSGVFLDVSPVQRRLPEAERLKLCLRKKCRTYSLARVDLVNLSVRGLREGQRVSVRLVVFGEGGEVLRRSAVRAPVRRVKPNGPKCPPTCFQVGVRLDRQSLRLEPTR